MSVESINRPQESVENQKSDSEKINEIQEKYPGLKNLGELAIINNVPIIKVSEVAEIPNIRKLEFGKQESLQKEETNIPIPHRQEIYEINGLIIKEYEIQDNDEFLNNAEMSKEYPVLGPIAIIKSEKGKLYILEQKGVNFRAYRELHNGDEKQKENNQKLFNEFMGKWIELKMIPRQFTDHELEKHLMVVVEDDREILKLIDVEGVVVASQADIDILEKKKNEYLKNKEKSQEELKTEISAYSHDVLNLLTPIKSCLQLFLKQPPKEKIDELKFHLDESITKFKNKLEGSKVFLETLGSINTPNKDNKKFLEYKISLTDKINKLVNDLENIDIKNISQDDISQIDKKIDDLVNEFRKINIYL